MRLGKGCYLLPILINVANRGEGGKGCYVYEKRSFEYDRLDEALPSGGLRMNLAGRKRGANADSDFRSIM